MCYTIDEIREKIEDTAQKYQIQQIILFGSYAKGTATEESDIDFVVLWAWQILPLRQGLSG